METWEGVHGALGVVACDAVARVEAVGHQACAPAHARDDALRLGLVLLIGWVALLRGVHHQGKPRLPPHAPRINIMNAFAGRQ